MRGRVSFPGIILTLLVARAGCAVAAAQATQPREQIPLIGPIEVGDVLDVSVFGATGPGRVALQRVRVAADGTASLYWIDDPVRLVRLDTSAAAKAIRKAYVDATVEGVDWVDVERIDSAARCGISPGPLKAGDLVDLTISDVNGPNADSRHLYRIESDGRIALPYVGLLRAGGLDEHGLETAVVKAYHDVNLIQRRGCRIEGSGRGQGRRQARAD